MSIPDIPLPLLLDLLLNSVSMQYKSFMKSIFSSLDAIMALEAFDFGPCLFVFIESEKVRKTFSGIF